MSAAQDFQVRGVKLVNERLDKLGAAVGIELLGRIVKKTPVDTGRARGNWNVSKNREDPTTEDERREPAALEEGGRVMETLKLSQDENAYVTNGLRYIGPLNNGHSQQAPAGFIQTTVREMERFVGQVARQLNSG